MIDGNKRLTKKINNILKIGAELFSKNGYAETSMDDIAAAVKLSKGGLYHYFKSKTELLYYIVDNFMDVVLEDLQEELNRIDDKLERVKRLIYRHVERYPRCIAEARTLFHDAHNLPPKAFNKIVMKEREYDRITANVLSDYFGSSLSKNQITAITFILLGMCNSIYSWYNPKSPITPEQLSEIIFNILTDGVCGLQQKNRQ
ncbi:MAG: TetR family transcriptional regulator [Spirochaetes bacterium]|nr:TetR family transcriptional regulator [Spirochaetota bacterium]